MTNLQKVRQRAESDARSRGYYLNPDGEFLNHLLEGLRQNEERYDYPSCPCRISCGEFEADRDIVCPCDYRDIDVEEYGCCYCALYVRRDVHEGKAPIRPIPERRPQEKLEQAYAFSPVTSTENLAKGGSTIVESSGAKTRLWYCKQCGYVCFREEPPYICPICKAKRKMFDEIRL